VKGDQNYLTKESHGPFWDKKQKYPKDNNNDLAMNSNNKNTRDKC
jgi:hypothetical protein